MESLNQMNEQATDAADVRVTAEELVKAVAAVEKRKVNSAPPPSDTILLGEAVQQLHLDVTPEDLLAEIRAQKRQNSSNLNTYPVITERQGNTGNALAAGIGLAILLFLSFQVIYLHYALARAATVLPPPAPSMSLSAPDAVTTETPAEVETTPPVEATEPATGTSSGAVEMKSLAEIAEGESADCDFDSLQALASGKSPEKVMGGVNMPWDDKLWTITRSDGQFKVHCFASSNDAVRIANGQAGHPYASPGENLTEFLLPVERFKDARFLDIQDHAGAQIGPNR
jgi:hypothetical protein